MLRDQRKIIHIDMDCFYAAVEMRDNPSLKEKPLAIGGRATQRGVLSTCNYPARKFGLHSAMPTARALQLCRDLILLPANMTKYRQVSSQIQQIFHRYTDMVEPLSLDEAYLDVSANTDCQGSASLLAKKICAEIEQEVKLTASAGIAPNKFLAKVASDWQKPNGHFVIPPEMIETFMMALPVSNIPGVGKVTTQKLHQLGIYRCDQLQAISQAELIEQFGKFGNRLYHYCRGQDDRPVQSSRIRKSLSVETTFIEDITLMRQCLDEIPKLFTTLLQRLEQHHDRRIHKQFIKMKFSDFSRCSKECVVSDLQQQTFFRLAEQAWQAHDQSIRLLGMGVRFAERNQDAQTSLLDI